MPIVLSAGFVAMCVTVSMAQIPYPYHREDINWPSIEETSYEIEDEDFERPSRAVLKSRNVSPWFQKLHDLLRRHIRQRFTRFNPSQPFSDQEAMSTAMQSFHAPPPSRQKKLFGGRNVRSYKNCFLSPVQCVMRGRVY